MEQPPSSFGSSQWAKPALYKSPNYSFRHAVSRQYVKCLVYYSTSVVIQHRRVLSCRVIDPTQNSHTPGAIFTFSSACYWSFLLSDWSARQKDFSSFWVRSGKKLFKRDKGRFFLWRWLFYSFLRIPSMNSGEDAGRLLIGRPAEPGAVNSTPLNRRGRAHFKDYFMSLLSWWFFSFSITKLPS